MQPKSESDFSMGTYFRTLRALYNRAISEKFAKQINYPFSRFKISKFSTETKKEQLIGKKYKKSLTFRF